ncbi:RNAse P, Rpr2/Rpp21 subunit [Metallosphaera tengchongensis]|uniref:RNAse P, Rpr2/Rpp21 subunit n=1 Tax=Metallosphaera tengchongensis TaxID=1532350 RepID=A0A6N0NW53_9CREN|nr:RNAse P, Rpr2/Rpp21 subunit [Metallosphaera tengchongensis]QKR01086.1 RNAse P, Rpr2/Rpp21 subunit [Metallosphaera tengchongensis]
MEAALLASKGELDLARKYVDLGLQYTSKARVKLPLRVKRSFCRKCKTPLIVGVTERRRIRSKILIRTCLVCGWTRRYDTRNQEKLKGSDRRERRGKNRKEGFHRGDQERNRKTPKGARSDQDQVT